MSVLLMFPFLEGEWQENVFFAIGAFQFLRKSFIIYVVACVYVFSLYISIYIFLNVHFIVVWLLLLLSCGVTDIVCNSSHVITPTVCFLGGAGKETSCKYEETKRFIP